jgi:hypothetical protein
MKIHLKKLSLQEYRAKPALLYHAADADAMHSPR